MHEDLALSLICWTELIFRILSGDGIPPIRPVDIREESDHFLLEADLPGLSERDIDIHIDGSRLTIKANLEQEQEKEDKSDKYLLRERRALRFTRSFALSQSVDTAKVEASFKNGILRITAPKKEQERTKKIAVKAA